MQLRVYAAPRTLPSARRRAAAPRPGGSGSRSAARLAAVAFSREALAAIRAAQRAAADEAGMFVAPPQLLLGVTRTDCEARALLEAAGLPADAAAAALGAANGGAVASRPAAAGDLHFTPDARESLDAAAEAAAAAGQGCAGTPHLLLGLLGVSNAAVAAALAKAGVDGAELQSAAAAAAATCREAAAPAPPPGAAQAAALVDAYQRQVAQHGGAPPPRGGGRGGLAPPAREARPARTRVHCVMAAITRRAVVEAAAGRGSLAAAAAAAVARLRGAPGRGGLDALEAVVMAAEAALHAGDLALARTCLETFFAEADPPCAGQLAARAHFAAGLLAAALASGRKGQALVAATLEAVSHVMAGVELAAAGGPRHAHLVYNGSVHFWHVCRPLHTDGLRAHLLPASERLNQAEGPRPEEAPKSLGRALELAAGAGLQELQAASATAAPGMAAAARRRTGELTALSADKRDEAGALSILQWVLSSRPDAAAAEQQLRAAWKMVDPHPDGPTRGALLCVVARIAWAATLAGAIPLAEACARRAAASPVGGGSAALCGGPGGRSALRSPGAVLSAAPPRRPQDLGPRVWADLARLQCALQAAPAPALAPPGSAAGVGAACVADALSQRQAVLAGVEEAVAAFARLHDAEGVSCCARLAWNAGLPLLQPAHRGALRRCFASVAQALESVASPLARLQVSLHLESAKAEAERESCAKAAREVGRALALNYASSAEAAALWGFERPLDRFIVPLARAARLRGGVTGGGAKDGGDGADDDDDAVVLLERARESRSAAMRGDHLRKAIDKLALLPPAPPPAAAPAGAPLDPARGERLRRTRARTELWGDAVQLAWSPYALEGLVRAAAPHVLAADWRRGGDPEMLLLQARVARRRRGGGPGAAELGGDGVRLPSATDEQLQRLLIEDLLLGMRLGGQPWVSMNGALAAWNAYLPLLQRQRHAELAGVALPLLSALLREPGPVDPDLCVMLAEAAAKAAEHAALLFVLRPPPGDAGDAGDAAPGPWSYRAGGTRWFVPLAEARRLAAALPDVPALLREAGAGGAAHCKFMSDSVDGCAAALSRAAAAAEPQGLLQALARLQQLLGRPAAAPSGAPAGMAVLAAIEALTAASPAGSAAAGPAAPAIAAGPARPPPGGGRGAAGPLPAGGVAKAEQELRGAMALLASSPAAHQELWAQLARAAARHGCWASARECAAAARAALPPGVARDLPALVRGGGGGALPASLRGARGYWAAVAEMADGQATLALLAPPAAEQDAAAQLALVHAALGHHAAAAALAGAVGRADLADAAARHAWNACTAGGGLLLSTPLTRAAAIPHLRAVSAALNATRPVDVRFQVACNTLLCECLASAGDWAAARLQMEALHRALPLSAAGPAGDAALAAAGWRAACIARTSGRAGEDFNRLLSELNTHQAKAHAWLCFARAVPSRREQLAARQAGLAASQGHALDAVEHALDLAGWLSTAGGGGGEPVGDEAPHPEALLRGAVATLLEFEAAGASDAHDASPLDCGGRAASPQGQRGGTAPAPGAARRRSGAASAIAAGRAGSPAGAERLESEAAAGPQGLSPRQLDQLIRALVLLSHVAPSAADRQQHLLHAQRRACQLLTSALAAAAPAAAAAQPHEAGSGAVLEPPAADSAPGGPGEAAGAAGGAVGAAGGAVAEPPAVPTELLDWAGWVPPPALLAALAAGSRPLSAAPDLLLAALERLAAELGTAGHHLHALPVLQLARLLALAACDDAALAAALALQLAAQCEALGLGSDAEIWLVLAAPEAWPSAPQLQQAAQQAAVQRLAARLLGRASGAAAAADAAAGGGSAAAAPADSACDSPDDSESLPHAGFLLAALQHVEPSTLRAWLSSPTGAAASSGGGGVLRAGAARGAPGALVSWLRPVALQGAWLRIARFLADRAQHPAAARLCGAALDLARSEGDADAEAEALLLQARLAAAAHQPERAVALLQAAQALGGPLELWAESVQLYAAVCGGVRRGGRHDAASALEGGLAMLGALEREGAPAAHLAVRAAWPIKLALAQRLAAGARQHTLDGEPAAAAQRHARALALVQGAAAELADAGAVLPRVAALTATAELMLADPRRPQQRQGAAQPLDERPLLLAVRQVLQVAEREAGALLASASPPAGPAVAAPASMPAARALAAVRLHLARVELQLGSQALALAAADAARRPAFPTVAGRDAAAVIAFLDGQAGGDSTAPFHELALAHAEAAAAALAAAPGERAAALVVAGRARAQQAHAAMLRELASSSGSGVLSRADPAAFDTDACWAPWPAQRGSSPPAPEGSAATERSVDGAARGPAEPSAAAREGPTEGLTEGRTVPPGAVQPLAEAVEVLGQALDDALEAQAFGAAREAALALARCHGLLQPARAAACLAVAQGCQSSDTVAGMFRRCAFGKGHPELVLQEQLEQLARVAPDAATSAFGAQLLAGSPAAGSCGAPPTPQARQALAAVGVTAERLCVGPPATLAPLLSGLQPEQRLLLLHYDAAREELLAAAWGTEPAPPQAPAPAPAPALPAVRRLGSAAAAPAGAAGGEASFAVVGAAPVPQSALEVLVARFRAHRRRLRKHVVQVTSLPPPRPAAAAGAAAGAPAPAVPGPRKAGAAAAGGPGGKPGGRDSRAAGGKASDAAGADEAEWLPVAPVFAPELDEEWDQLMREVRAPRGGPAPAPPALTRRRGRRRPQFEVLLQPLAGLLLRALPPRAAQLDAAADAKPGAAGAPGGSRLGRAGGAKAAAAAQAASPAAAPALLSVQLLLDPELCLLPWEALPWLQAACCAAVRCFSAAQLAALAAAAPAPLSLGGLTYVADPAHELSAGPGGLYAPPLLPALREQLLEPLGREWQGLAGAPGRAPPAAALARLMAGARGLLFLAPGRLLRHVPPHAVAELDLSGCAAALVLDRLPERGAPAAACTPRDGDEDAVALGRAPEGPTRAAMLLLARGVRAVAVATAAATPAGHLGLAGAVLRGLGAGRSLAEAVWAAARRERGGPPEPAALRAAGLVVYGWGGLTAAPAAADGAIVAFDDAARRATEGADASAVGGDGALAVAAAGGGDVDWAARFFSGAGVLPRAPKAARGAAEPLRRTSSEAEAAAAAAAAREPPAPLRRASYCVGASAAEAIAFHQRLAMLQRARWAGAPDGAWGDAGAVLSPRSPASPRCGRRARRTSCCMIPEGVPLMMRSRRASCCDSAGGGGVARGGPAAQAAALAAWEQQLELELLAELRRLGEALWEPPCEDPAPGAPPPPWGAPAAPALGGGDAGSPPARRASTSALPGSPSGWPAAPVGGGGAGSPHARRASASALPGSPPGWPAGDAGESPPGAGSCASGSGWAAFGGASPMGGWAPRPCASGPLPASAVALPASSPCGPHSVLERLSSADMAELLFCGLTYVPELRGPTAEPPPTSPRDAPGCGLRQVQTLSTLGMVHQELALLLQLRGQLSVAAAAAPAGSALAAACAAAARMHEEALARALEVEAALEAAACPGCHARRPRRPLEPAQRAWPSHHMSVATAHAMSPQSTWMQSALFAPSPAAQAPRSCAAPGDASLAAARHALHAPGGGYGEDQRPRRSSYSVQQHQIAAAAAAAAVAVQSRRASIDRAMAAARRNSLDVAAAAVAARRASIDAAHAHAAAVARRESIDAAHAHAAAVARRESMDAAHAHAAAVAGAGYAYERTSRRLSHDAMRHAPAPGGGPWDAWGHPHRQPPLAPRPPGGYDEGFTAGYAAMLGSMAAAAPHHHHGAALTQAQLAALAGGRAAARRSVDLPFPPLRSERSVERAGSGGSSRSAGSALSAHAAAALCGGGGGGGGGGVGSPADPEEMVAALRRRGGGGGVARCGSGFSSSGSLDELDRPCGEPQPGAAGGAASKALHMLEAEVQQLLALQQKLAAARAAAGDGTAVAAACDAAAAKHERTMATAMEALHARADEDPAAAGADEPAALRGGGGAGASAPGRRAGSPPPPCEGYDGYGGAPPRAAWPPGGGGGGGGAGAGVPPEAMALKWQQLEALKQMHADLAVMQEELALLQVLPLVTRQHHGA
ncbi:CFAP46 [Scenedesmus sp. PABB004]|nr:CFAP46 [Scenedesmus sp. PABB004]